LKRHVSSLEEARKSAAKGRPFFQEDKKETVAEEERHVDPGLSLGPFS